MTVEAPDPAVRLVPSWVGDLGAVAVALVLGGLAADASDPTSGVSEVASTVVGVAVIAAVWWRRRWPVLLAMVAVVATVVSPLAAGAAIVGVYTVAARCAGRVVVGVAGFHAAALSIGAVVHPDTDSTVVQNVAVGVLLTACAVGWGRAARSRAARVEALAERARRIEVEQHARIAEARRAERERIAGDIHDALAHRLSMLSVHAGALELRPDAPSEDRSRSAAIVRSHAHLALDDLRAAIGLLRDDADSDAAVRADVAELIDECRVAGMRIVTDGLEWFGEVPASLRPHVYRIVQEGLTNARKHGIDDDVHVALGVRPDDGVCIEVVNATAGDGGRAAGVVVPGGGVGLRGITQRVNALGGSVSHGRHGRHRDRYRLKVSLPWRT